MQISTNTTSMPADLTVPTDKDGRSTCVVAIKGTYVVGQDGSVRFADQQEPLAYSDVHWGDPATTSIRYDCDFAPVKPRTDVVVIGEAVSPTGSPVTELFVWLRMSAREKVVRVIGNRTWDNGSMRWRPTVPAPFTSMPLIFERSFGGTDTSHANPRIHGAEMRNPIGVGFHKNSEPVVIQGTPLPNLERPDEPYGTWSDCPRPIGLGCIGRGWHPRVKYAGTYDDEWVRDRCPLLPQDFDTQYFQAAPSDQQIPHVRGGEVIECLNMSHSGRFIFQVPRIELPVLFRFEDHDVTPPVILDTISVEPGKGRCMLTWRAAVPLGRKMNALREIIVGVPPRPHPPRTVKPHFESLSQFIVWKQESARSENVDET